MFLKRVADRAGGITPDEIRSLAAELLTEFSSLRGEPQRVLIVPPDNTRLHSLAGPITREFARLLGPRLSGILPATGTHRAMGREEIAGMFGDLDPGLFLEHDHRRGNRLLGELPASYLEELSGGRLSLPFPCEVDARVPEGGYDLILSIGQVVPHEVVGLANYTKNILVGLGGNHGIAISHWLGALAGLESIMGRADTPVRRLLDEGARRFLGDVPLLYVLTVLARNGAGRLELKGLYAGEGPGATWLPAAERDEGACYTAAAEHSARINVEVLPEAIRRCVVRLEPREYRSTWLGNKAVYRTRMALADGADLFILAPGVERFGEDLAIDRLIRRHGYRGGPAILEAVARDPELAGSLSAAAHLVHGSSEGRFRITYCTDPRLLSRKEVEDVGYSWMDIDRALALFDAGSLKDGWNGSGEGRVFYVSNPALGLWRRADT